jgi:hypothetical protein
MGRSCTKSKLGSYVWETTESSSKFKKRLRRPGFEPGSTAWKAAILTARLTSPGEITSFFIEKNTLEYTN